MAPEVPPMMKSLKILAAPPGFWLLDGAVLDIDPAIIYSYFINIYKWKI